MQLYCTCSDSISHTRELCEVCAYEYNQWAEERAQEDALAEHKGLTPELMPGMAEAMMILFDSIIGELKEAA